MEQSVKLTTNSKCQLILDGPKPEAGLELIVYGDEYVLVDRDSDLWRFDMPEDGLFQYFVLPYDEIREATDLIEFIQDKVKVPQAEVFSICKLRNCLLKMEKDYVNSFLKGCATNSHCSNDSENTMRDFLLATVFVLEHLICAGNTSEALRILKNIQSCTSCANINSKNNCGCNGRVN